MKLFERLWATASCVLNWLTLSPKVQSGYKQSPLIGKYSFEHGYVFPAATTTTTAPLAGPTFKPPGGRYGDLPGAGFQCEYPDMIGYEYCSNENDRTCWLRSTKDSTVYGISTDYEKLTPTGIHRYYKINATDHRIDADGIVDVSGKAFQLIHPDGKTGDEPIFPGPWIQACWGDTVHVLVGNSMTDNGTSVHWHGIRQLNSMHMDGVNGVTQCPIPPKYEFEYVFKVTQYGSSWYHSHYSVQYADGLQGPITLHGPSSSYFDEAFYPTIITDWGHNSAFYSLTHTMLDATMLINGTGDVRQFGFENTTAVKPKYHVNFDKPAGNRNKRYLMRIINTSFDTMIGFSIDHHVLQVVAADFVPIKPYNTQAIKVAIGQRYNIIVEADMYNSGLIDFWIRVWVITQCTEKIGVPTGTAYSQAGIVRYDPSSTADPVSKPWPMDNNCTDEPYQALSPVFPWFPGNVANGGQKGEELDTGYAEGKNTFDIGTWSVTKTWPAMDPAWAFQINYSKPTFLDMWNNGPWLPQNVVIQENYTEHDWVYFVISGADGGWQHPLHLHGHDFAVLNISEKPFDRNTFKMSCAPGSGLNCWNPARRDVVTLPSNGYVVIAFKTDNPGSWLMHCHIAFHASRGLALQILERLPDANALWPPNSPAIKNAEVLCRAWDDWWKNQKEDDSGI